MCAGPEVAVERDGLLLMRGVTGGRCECATDLLAVDGYRERGIALGIAGAVTVGVGILADLEHQAVGAGAEFDRGGGSTGDTGGCAGRLTCDLLIQNGSDIATLPFAQTLSPVFPPEVRVNHGAVTHSGCRPSAGSGS